MNKFPLLLMVLVLSVFSSAITTHIVSRNTPKSPLVLLTDYGSADGTVSEIKGFAVTIAPQVTIYDLTHDISPFDIWTGANRLLQALEYWPKSTVFVSIIDPGVGSGELSIVAKTRDGKYIVTPDNGTLTLIADEIGIEEIREIDIQSLPIAKNITSAISYQQNAYIYTGARLAAGLISFKEVGSIMNTEIVKLPYQKSFINESNALLGSVSLLEQYGNVWTNISQDILAQFGVNYGQVLQVSIYHYDTLTYRESVPFFRYFSDVPVGEPLLYLNNTNHVSIALNLSNFAVTHGISYGNDWRVEIRKIKEKE